MKVLWNFLFYFFRDRRISKPVSNCIFTGMPEWWIAKIMGQTCCSNHGSDVLGRDIFETVLFTNCLANDCPQGSANARNLKAMSQSGSYIIAFRKWENLSFILEAPESG